MRVQARTADLMAANRRLEEQVDEREEAEKELRHTLHYQEIVASILRLSLQPISLDNVLARLPQLDSKCHGFWGVWGCNRLIYRGMGCRTRL